MPTTPNVLIDSRLRLGVCAAAMSALSLMGCGGDLSHQKKQSVTLSAAAGTTLRISNKVGDVKLIADPAAIGVTAEVVKIGKGSSEQKAREALDEIKVVLAEESGSGGGGELVGRAIHPNSSGGWSGKGYEVVWTITAPPSIPIIVVDNVGDVAATGFEKGVNLTTDVGDLHAVQIRGGVVLTSNVGDVEVKGDAPIKATSDVGDIHLTVLGGEEQMITGTTDVGDVHVTMPHAWAGRLDASTDVGSINTDIPNLRAKGKGSSKSLSADIGAVGAGKKASMRLQSDVGDVTIKTAEAK